MFVHSNMGWALDLQARQALWMLISQKAKPTSACPYSELRDVESVCVAFVQTTDAGSWAKLTACGATFCKCCKASGGDHGMQSAVLLLSSTLL